MNQSRWGDRGRAETEKGERDLSPREQQIIEGLAAGKTLKEMGVPPVEVWRMRKRLGYRTTTQMVCQMEHKLHCEPTGKHIESPRT